MKVMSEVALAVQSTAIPLGIQRRPPGPSPRPRHPSPPRGRCRWPRAQGAPPANLVVVARQRRYFLALSTALLSDESAAMKASWGTSTRPTIFIRFLPSFCFSSSLRLRLMSPP